MAFPTFTKAGVASVFLSRGDTYPTRKPIQARQRIGKSHAGEVHVATLSPPEYLHVLTFSGLTTTDRANILAFLNDPLVNWAQESWAYSDVAGVTYTVRWLDGGLDFEETSPGQWAGTITLREEIA